MLIFALIFLNNGKKRLFKSNFIIKNRTKFYIVYNNKRYPLQENYNFNKVKTSKINIKLIYLNDNYNISDIIKGCELFEEIYIKNKNEKDYDKYLEFIKCSDKYKMIYIINSKEKTIKIFGKDFVKNNKDKCIILYNDKLLPLKEYFSLNNIENVKDKLDLILLEFDVIYDRSYMFHKCNSLEIFDFIEDKKENNMIDESRYEKNNSENSISF